MTSTYEYHGPVERKTHANNYAWFLQKWRGKMIHFSSTLGIEDSMKQRACGSKFYSMTSLRLYKRKHFLMTVF